MISVIPSVPVSESLAAYCFGRMLADRFGMEFSYPALRSLVKNEGAQGRRRIGRDRTWRGNGPFCTLTGQRVEVPEFMAEPYSGLQLDGNGFQRWEWLSLHRERILNEWVSPAHTIDPREPEEFAICLAAPTERPAASTGKHTEKVESGCIGELEIRRLTRISRRSRFVLVVERVEHPVIEAVSDLKLPVLVAEDWEQFLWIRAFSKVAISQNARHWWAALTGAAREIYFPQTNKGPWAKPERPILAHRCLEWVKS